MGEPSASSYILGEWACMVDVRGEWSYVGSSVCIECSSFGGCSSVNGIRSGCWG